MTREVNPQLLTIPPMLAEAVRCYGSLLNVETLTVVTIAKVMARRPIFQELDLGELELDEALEFAAHVRLVSTAEVEKLKEED